MDLTKTKDIVHMILIKDLGSRNDDNRLYLNVCEYLNPNAIRKPFCEIARHPQAYGLPGFETVRRSRQKIQEECPELGADTRTKQKRMECEQLYLEFARRKD